MSAHVRMDRTKVHAGSGLADASERMLDAVARFERGESVEENHVSFKSWAALFSILTLKRYDLLRHVHQHPEKSIRSLARSIATSGESTMTCGRSWMPDCWKPTNKGCGRSTKRSKCRAPRSLCDFGWCLSLKARTGWKAEIPVGFLGAKFLPKFSKLGSKPPAAMRASFSLRRRGGADQLAPIAFSR